VPSGADVRMTSHCTSPSRAVTRSSTAGATERVATLSRPVHRPGSMPGLRPDRLTSVSESRKAVSASAGR
jgi:hypothetical protein